MTRPRRRNRSLVYALYLNAGLLLVILVVLLSRGGAGLNSTALAGPQHTPPIAGGGGLFLMPAQFSVNTWGCYIMDIDAQTLCAYQYQPQSQEGLKLVAARHFRYDRMLKRYNTRPFPEEIQNLVEIERAAVRGREKPNGTAPDQGGDLGPAVPVAPEPPGAPGTVPPVAPNDPAAAAAPVDAGPVGPTPPAPPSQPALDGDKTTNPR